MTNPGPGAQPPGQPPAQPPAQPSGQQPGQTSGQPPGQPPAQPPYTPPMPAPPYLPPAPPPPSTAAAAPPARDSLGRVAAKSAIVTTIVLLVFGLFSSVSLFGSTVLLAGVTASLGETPTGLPTRYVTGEPGAEGRLLAVPVDGIILGEAQGPPGLFDVGGVTYGYDIKEALEEAAEDETIDGVVLELDTPGGTIFGSQAILEAVDEYRERTGNEVVAYVAGLSASGGVWSMSSSDWVVAAPGSAVGSVGVISGPFTTYSDVVATDGGLLGTGVETRGGVSEEYITAGEGKDLGNPYRPITETERAILQDNVDASYEDFVRIVSERRGIPERRVVAEIGAHVYTAQIAEGLGLVDEVGGRDRAYEVAAERNGIEGDYVVERVIGPEDDLLGLFGVASGTGADPAQGQGTSDGAGPGGGSGGQQPLTGVDVAGELCGVRGGVLAYAGDLGRVCAP